MAEKNPQVSGYNTIESAPEKYFTDLGRRQLRAVQEARNVRAQRVAKYGGFAPYRKYSIGKSR